MPDPKPNPSRRSLLAGAGGLLFTTALPPSSTETTTPSQPTQQTTTTTTSTVPPGTSPSEVIPVGKAGTFRSEDQSVRLTYRIEKIDIFESYSSAGETVNSDGTFVQVVVTARNDTTEPHTISSEYFELVTPSGQAYEPYESAMLDFRNTLYSEDIDPKIKKTRSVIFSVPENSAPWWLKVSGGTFHSGDSVYFDLPTTASITSTTSSNQ